jgi:hypothetical protein
MKLKKGFYWIKANKNNKKTIGFLYKHESLGYCWHLIGSDGMFPVEECKDIEAIRRVK